MSPGPTPEPRLATVADAGAIGAMLGRAFSDDPLFRWLLPNDATRTARIARLFVTVARHLHLPHRASSTFDGFEGAALWVPPGIDAMTLRAMFFMGPDTVRAMSSSLIAGGRVIAAMEHHHPKEPHHYLAVLGVDPPHQGRGLSTKLLSPTLARADSEKRIAYLETAKETNVPLYRRFGFEVTRELEVGQAPPLWLMTRKPR